MEATLRNIVDNGIKKDRIVNVTKGIVVANAVIFHIKPNCNFRFVCVAKSVPR